MKKIIAAAAALCTVLSIAGYAAFALLNAKTKATNTFTYGSINISLSEKYEKPNKVIMPGVTLNKNLTVKNDGKDNCYVRILMKDNFKNGKSAADYGCVYKEGSENWIVGKDGHVYYTKILKPGEVSDALPVSITFPENLSDEVRGSEFITNSKAYAVQSDNNEIPIGGSVTELVGWPAD